MAPVVTLQGATGREYSTGSEADFIATLSEPSLETVVSRGWWKLFGGVISG